MTAREPPHCPTCHCGSPDPLRERIAELEEVLGLWKVAMESAIHEGGELLTANKRLREALTAWGAYDVACFTDEFDEQDLLEHARRLTAAALESAT